MRNNLFEAYWLGLADEKRFLLISFLSNIFKHTFQIHHFIWKKFDEQFAFFLNTQ